MFLGCCVASYPPTREQKRQYRQIQRYIENFFSYLSFSTVPTEEYLNEVLRLIPEIQSTIDGLSGILYSEIARVVRWVQTNRHLSSHEILAKYPVALDCVKRESDTELASMFHADIHHHRLGAEIDKVFGFNRTSEAEEVGTMQS
jgi:hypothetical protein